MSCSDGARFLLKENEQNLCFMNLHHTVAQLVEHWHCKGHGFDSKKYIKASISIKVSAKFMSGKKCECDLVHSVNMSIKIRELFFLLTQGFSKEIYPIRI